MHVANAQDKRMNKLTMRVVEARMLNPLIKLFRLQSADGAVLPGFDAGAHVRVQVRLADGKLDWRHYSLIDLSNGAAVAPKEYLIAVRREDDGRGGSRFMHQQLAQGDIIELQPPKNDFALRDHASAAVLIAGGIGITPLIGMAARRKAAGLPVRLHYAARSRELMAFDHELRAMLGADLHPHFDIDAGAALNVAAVLDRCADDDHVYVCGPKPMLDAVLANASAHGWPRDRIHFELFSAGSEQGNGPCSETTLEVMLAQSGRTVMVPPGRSILDCLIDEGIDPLFDCKRGECGVCQCPVIEGEIEHRDYFLSDAEKASGRVMQICVSRARSARLVLDL